MAWGNKIPHGKKGLTIAALVLSTFAYSQRSITNINEVREPLQTVTVCARLAIKEPLGFIVVDGGRTLEEHKINVANGKSWIRRSRHQDGAAIDFAATIHGKVTYAPEPYYKIADAFSKCSLKHDIPIIWGGSWRVADLMHIELDKKRYP
jgi:peptidoglycan L-alanyl-D-glutamate endopeptidase CwlK